MDTLWFFALVFVIVFAGAVVGALLQVRLPERLKEARTKETVQLVMGLIATVAGLVMGLLIASSQAYFETQQEEVQKLARDVILLDETLASYGPETATIRQALVEVATSVVNKMSPTEGVGAVDVMVAFSARPKAPIVAPILMLDAHTESQRFNRSRALDLVKSISATRLLIHEQANNGMPTLFVVTVITWLTLLFVGFGLFAPVNEVAMAAMGLGAFSVASAIFLVVDMGHPYEGPMRISPTIFEAALRQLGH